MGPGLSVFEIIIICNLGIIGPEVGLAKLLAKPEEAIK